MDISKVTPMRAVWYGLKVAIGIYALLWIIELMEVAYKWYWRI